MFSLPHFVLFLEIVTKLTINESDTFDLKKWYKSIIIHLSIMNEWSQKYITKLL